MEEENGEGEGEGEGEEGRKVGGGGGRGRGGGGGGRKRGGVSKLHVRFNCRDFEVFSFLFSAASSPLALKKREEYKISTTIRNSV